MSLGGFQIPNGVRVDGERLFLIGEFLERLRVVLMPSNYCGHFLSPYFGGCPTLRGFRRVGGEHCLFLLHLGVLLLLCRSDDLQFRRDLHVPGRRFDLLLPRGVASLHDLDGVLARRHAQ